MKNIKITPPKDDDIESWVDGIIALLQKHQENSRYWHLKLTVDNFPPDKYKHYQRLQERIAEIAPNESARPTIHLKIRGEKAKHSKNPDFVYLGGTGPLSDAAALGGIIGEYRKTKISEDVKFFCADLYSSPPPRKGDLDEKAHLAEYLPEMTRFMVLNNAPQYCMLSNTAHLNAEKVIWLLNISKQGVDVPKVINLVDKMVAEIASEKGWEGTRKPTNVLVCGTDVAHDGRLYPDKFNKPSVNVKSTLPDQDGKVLLQNLINAIKGGKINKPFDDSNPNQTSGDRLIEFLIYQMKTIEKEQGKIPSHIILSCTELPLCFHTPKEGDGRTYHEIFNARCKEAFGDSVTPPTIIDTEHGMAKNIASIQNQAEMKRRMKHLKSTKTQSTIRTLNALCEATLNPKAIRNRLVEQTVSAVTKSSFAKHANTKASDKDARTRLAVKVDETSDEKGVKQRTTKELKK